MTEETFPRFASSFLITKKQCLRKFRLESEDDVVIWDGAPNPDTIWPPELREEYLRYKAERERKKKP